MHRRQFHQTILLSSASLALAFSPHSVSVSAESAVQDTVSAASWSPVLNKTEILTERKLEWFTHGSKPDWNAADPGQRDTFAVLHPKTGERAGLPLYVVLHSAGHSVQSCLECTKTKGNHDIYHAPDGFFALYVDCAANRIDWWWGGLSAHETVNGANRVKAGLELTPCEKRIIDTVKWTIAKYQIDPDRVYLCGNSMGGSGTLGIGLRHGDIFAAIKANVPAGAQHAAHRMGFVDAEGKELPPDAVPAGLIPEPPVCIDYSGTNDGWSNGHELLFSGMKRHRYPLIAYWGAFGHANNTEKICEVNDLIESFDWLSIRKNAAYPVFTNAQSDDPVPWPEREKCTTPGQVNAWFRWENVTDSPRDFEMDLWLVSNEELRSKFFTVPQNTTADVTLRRLQELKLTPNQTVRWEFGRRSGTAKTDQRGVLSIPALTLTQQKTRLKIRVQ